MVKRKIPSPRRESNRRTPIVQPVAQRYTDWAITGLTKEQLAFKNLRNELFLEEKAIQICGMRPTNCTVEETKKESQ
jgi:hypothetical protein